MLALALVAAACGDDDDDGDTGADGDDGPTSSGSIIISGSSTVEPISSLVAEMFNESEPRCRRSPSTARAPATGSSSSAAERPTSPMPRGRSRTKRSKACKENGIDYTELEVALDGLTVMTNPENAT